MNLPELFKLALPTYSGEARIATPVSRTWAHHVIGHSAGGVRDGRFCDAAVKKLKVRCWGGKIGR